MTWSTFLTSIRSSLQRSPRTGPVGFAILHHGATTNVQWMEDAMVSGSKQVSATVVVKDGRRTGIVDEDFRPWTSSSAYWDGRACTIECANESTNGWTISDASYESMALLLADWSKRYAFPLVRNGRKSTVFGHKELYTYFGDSYATACPGGMDVDRVVRRANEILAGPVPDEPKKKIPLWEKEDQENDMSLFLIAANDSEGRWGKPRIHYALVGPEYFVRFNTPDAANALAVRFGNAANVTYSEWEAFEKAAAK